MSRGYRIIILATVGWLILASAPTPSDKSQYKQTETSKAVPESAQSIAVSLSGPVEVIQRPEAKPPCGPRKYSSDDDLCAQWKAADAATDGARWSFWSLILAAVGTIGVLISLYYTRKAVLAAEDATRDADLALAIAERNANAAALQVETFQKNARLQLRAHLSAKSLRVDDGEKYGRSGPCMALEIVNYGQTPALLTTIKFTALWICGEVTETLYDEEAVFDTFVYRGTPIIIPIDIEWDMSVEEQGHFLAIGALRFRDAFDAKRINSFFFNSVVDYSEDLLGTYLAASAGIKEAFKKYKNTQE